MTLSREGKELHGPGKKSCPSRGGAHELQHVPEQLSGQRGKAPGLICVHKAQQRLWGASSRGARPAAFL